MLTSLSWSCPGLRRDSNFGRFVTRAYKHNGPPRGRVVIARRAVVVIGPEPVGASGSVFTYSVCRGISLTRAGATQERMSRNPIGRRVPMSSAVEYRLQHLLPTRE